jgi:hypothetical protein
VKRENPEREARLQGFVTAVSGQYFQVLGATISSQNADFTGADGKAISALDFFSRLDEGTFLKVTGTETTNMTIDADEISLRLDD